MKKKTFVSIIVTVVVTLCLLSLPLMLVIPRVMFNLSLKDLKNESDSIPPHVVYGVLHTEEERVPVSQILRKQSKNYSLEEIFCIANNQAYFCYRDSTETDIWRLASIDLDTKDITDLIQFIGASERNYRTNYAGTYSERCGYYYNGQIVLNDMNQVLAYDIMNGNYSVTDYSEYAFPQHIVIGECTDNQTLKLYLDGVFRSFTFSELAEYSENIARIYAIGNKRTWDGTVRSSGFFGKSNIFTIDDKVYTLQPILNFCGETHMFIFEYDDSGKWLFVSKCFVGDILRGKCYILPAIA